MQAYSSDWEEGEEEEEEDYDDFRLHKGRWTAEETLRLVDLVRASAGQADGGAYPPAFLVDWKKVATAFNKAQAKSKRKSAPLRHSKQCRERYVCHCVDGKLKPVEMPWMPQEEYVLCLAYCDLGSCWTEIEHNYLPHRTSAVIKNHFNSRARSAAASKPVTPPSLISIFAGLVRQDETTRVKTVTERGKGKKRPKPSRSDVEAHAARELILQVAHARYMEQVEEWGLWGDGAPGLLDVVVDRSYFLTGLGRAHVEEVLANPQGNLTEDGITTSLAGITGITGPTGMTLGGGGVSSGRAAPAPASGAAAGVRLVAAPTTSTVLTAHAPVQMVEGPTVVSGDDGASGGLQRIPAHPSPAAVAAAEASAVQQERARRASSAQRSVRPRAQGPEPVPADRTARHEGAVRMVAPPMVAPAAGLDGPSPHDASHFQGSAYPCYEGPIVSDTYMILDGTLAGPDAAAYGAVTQQLLYASGVPNHMAADGNHTLGGWHVHKGAYGGAGGAPHVAGHDSLVPRASFLSGWDSPRISTLSGLPSHSMGVQEPGTLDDLLHLKPNREPVAALISRTNFGATESYQCEGDAWAAVQLWMPSGPAVTCTQPHCVPAGDGHPKSQQQPSSSTGVPATPNARPPLAAHPSLVHSSGKRQRASDGHCTASTGLPQSQLAHDQLAHEAVMDFITSPEFGAVCELVLAGRQQLLPSAGPPNAQRGIVSGEELHPTNEQPATDAAAAGGGDGGGAGEAVAMDCGPDRQPSLRFGMADPATDAAASQPAVVPPHSSLADGPAAVPGAPAPCTSDVAAQHVRKAAAGANLQQGAEALAAAVRARPLLPPAEQGAHLHLPRLRGLSVAIPRGPMNHLEHGPQVVMGGAYGPPPAVAARNPFAGMGSRSLMHHGYHVPPHYLHGYMQPPHIGHQYGPHGMHVHPPYHAPCDPYGPFARLPHTSDAHSLVFGRGGDGTHTPYQAEHSHSHGAQPSTARSHAPSPLGMGVTVGDVAVVAAAPPETGAASAAGPSSQPPPPLPQQPPPQAQPPALVPVGGAAPLPLVDQPLLPSQHSQEAQLHPQGLVPVITQMLPAQPTTGQPQTHASVSVPGPGEQRGRVITYHNHVHPVLYHEQLQLQGHQVLHAHPAAIGRNEAYPGMPSHAHPARQREGYHPTAMRQHAAAAAAAAERYQHHGRMQHYNSSAPPYDGVMTADGPQYIVHAPHPHPHHPHLSYLAPHPHPQDMHFPHQPHAPGGLRAATANAARWGSDGGSTQHTHGHQHQQLPLTAVAPISGGCGSPHEVQAPHRVRALSPRQTQSPGATIATTAAAAATAAATATGTAIAAATATAATAVATATAAVAGPEAATAALAATDADEGPASGGPPGSTLGEATGGAPATTEATAAIAAVM